ncbi:MAG: hypothetical protein WBC02_10750, partial [Candidatus Aminicenantaceae bacterium]
KKAKKVIFKKAVRARIKNPGLFKKLFNFPISKPLTKLVAKTKSLAFFIRTFQTMKTLRLTKKTTELVHKYSKWAF